MPIEKGHRHPSRWLFKFVWGHRLQGAQNRTGKVSSDNIRQIGPSQVSPGQVSLGKVGPVQVGTEQVGLSEVGPGQVSPVQVGP